MRVVHTAINMNDKCIVKLTSSGRKLLEDHYAQFWKPVEIDETIRVLHKPDDEGNMQFQLWVLFEIFGPHLYLGMPEVPFLNNQIELKSV